LINWWTVDVNVKTLLLTPQARTSGESVLGTNINLGSAIAMGAAIVGCVL